MLQQSDAQESEVRTFIREIRQYVTIQELDETVLNRLITDMEPEMFYSDQNRAVYETRSV